VQLTQPLFSYIYYMYDKWPKGVPANGQKQKRKTVKKDPDKKNR